MMANQESTVVIPQSSLEFLLKQLNYEGSVEEFLQKCVNPDYPRHWNMWRGRAKFSRCNGLFLLISTIVSIIIWFSGPDLEGFLWVAALAAFTFVEIRVGQMFRKDAIAAPMWGSVNALIEGVVLGAGFILSALWPSPSQDMSELLGSSISPTIGNTVMLAGIYTGIAVFVIQTGVAFYYWRAKDPA